MKKEFLNKQLSEDMTLVELYDENGGSCGVKNDNCPDIVCDNVVNVGVGGACKK